jgi:hypothetical protein
MPKLTLRDLFWLVLVAAILCAWWLDRQRAYKEGYQVGRDRPPSPACSIGPDYKPPPGAKPSPGPFID